MRDLASIQRTFYDLVTAGEGTIVPGLLGDSRHLDVYAEMYLARLHDVLADDYPKLRAVLGDAGFHELAAAYVHAKRPRSFTVRDVGLALPGYLASRDDLPPWSADLAALERARVEVFDAADASACTREDVARLPPERFPELALALVSASAVVPLSWTVDDLWSAIEDDTPRDAPVACDRVVLIWRRGPNVVHRTLDDDEARLASRLAEGTTLAHVSAQLVELEAPNPEHRMVELLARWLDAELLIRA